MFINADCDVKSQIVYILIALLRESVLRTASYQRLEKIIIITYFGIKSSNGFLQNQRIICSSCKLCFTAKDR